MQMGETTITWNQKAFMLLPFQLEQTSVGEHGTLLQEAVLKDKQNFVLLLLKHGLVW